MGRTATGEPAAAFGVWSAACRSARVAQRESRGDERGDRDVPQGRAGGIAGQLPRRRAGSAGAGGAPGARRPRARGGARADRLGARFSRRVAPARDGKDRAVRRRPRRCVRAGARRPRVLPRPRRHARVPRARQPALRSRIAASGDHGRAPRDAGAPGARRARARARDGSRLDAAPPASPPVARRGDPAPGGKRLRPRGPAGAARVPRLRAAARGRGGGTVRAPRRDRRRVRGGTRRSRPARVRRRYAGVAAPLRRGHAALARAAQGRGDPAPLRGGGDARRAGRGPGSAAGGRGARRGSRRAASVGGAGREPGTVPRQHGALRSALRPRPRDAARLPAGRLHRAAR